MNSALLSSLIVIMPSAKRKDKALQKDLAAVAKSHGQKTITSMFKMCQPDSDVPASEAQKFTSNVSASSSTHCDNMVGSCESEKDTDVCGKNSNIHNIPIDPIELNTGISNSDAQMSEIWVRTSMKFSVHDKKLSEVNGRFCQGEWLDKYEWASYNRVKKSIFCDTCSSFANLRDGVFIYEEGNEKITVNGFTNWKNGSERLKDHDLSDTHQKATAVKVQNLSASSSKSLLGHFSSGLIKKQKLRFHGLISHFGTLKTLLRQGVPIRGDVDEQSNIYQFNLDKSKNDEGLKALLNSKSYTTSHDILREQEEMIVLAARRKLLNDVQHNRYYSLIIDESCDISKKEQISLSFRTCNNDYKVSEDFIGIMECNHGMTADLLLQYVIDIFLRCAINCKNLVGMAFDGASSMKLLAKKLKDIAGTQALYVHCFAHCNELVLQDAYKKSNLVSDALDICQSLYAIIGAYPKRVLLFDNIQKDIQQEKVNDNYTVQKLKNLCVTRWTTRGAAAIVIFEKLNELQTVLKSIAADQATASDTRATIQGLLVKLSKKKSCFNWLL